VLQLWRRLTGSKPLPQAPYATEEPISFDVLVALGPYNLPPGVRPADAIRPIKAAVQAIDGVGWVNVENHSVAAPGAASWLEVFPSLGNRAPDDNAARAAIHRRAEAVVVETLGALPKSDPEPSALMAEPSLGERLLPHTVLAPRPAPPRKPWPGTSKPPGFSDGVDLRALPPLRPAQVSDTTLEAAMLSRLLAFVLPGDAASSTAERTLTCFGGSFAAALAAPESELRAIRGLGQHSIAAVKLVHTAAVRLARARAAEGPVLENWDQLMAYLNVVLARERVEQFRILFLDGDRRLLADEAQARGTVNHTPVYPREVVRRALELKAESLVLVHNHPSGDPSPSGADLDMTAQIQAAARVVSLAIADHVIVGNGRWLSFRQEGLL
jgi:DNA repair protein RadC